MVAIHETAYPRLSYNVTKNDLQRIYTPLPDEFRWLKKQRLNEGSRLVAMIYLKCFQRLGYFPKLEDIPSPITQHIASCQKIPLDGFDSRGLAASSTQRWLKNRIRDYCGVSKFTLAEKGHWLKSFALSMARTKENMVDIINAMLELLVKEQFELPALSTLERIAFSARARINADTFDQIERSLSAETKQQLLNLLSETTAEGTTLWHQVKREPEKPSVSTLQRFIEHTAWLKRLQHDIGDLPAIPEEKRVQFYHEAKAYTSDKMKEIQYKKRVALMALVVREQLLRSTDNLVDLFIKELRKLHAKSQLELKCFQENAVTESERLICMLRDVSITLSSDAQRDKQYHDILSTLEHNPQNVVTRCDRLVTYGLNNPLQFIAKRYTKPAEKSAARLFVTVRDRPYRTR